MFGISGSTILARDEMSLTWLDMFREFVGSPPMLVKTKSGKGKTIRGKQWDKW